MHQLFFYLTLHCPVKTLFAKVSIFLLSVLMIFICIHLVPVVSICIIFWIIPNTSFSNLMFVWNVVKHDFSDKRQSYVKYVCRKCHYLFIFVNPLLILFSTHSLHSTHISIYPISLASNLFFISYHK